MKTSALLALMILLALPTICDADLEVWTQFSVEWLADASDAIAIGEIQAIDPSSPHDRTYEIIEIIKPHAFLDEEQVHLVERVGRTQGKAGDTTLLFFREEEGLLTCYHTVWLQRTDTLAYDIHSTQLQSEFRVYFGIDARGVLIETPEEFIKRIHERLSVSRGLPEGVERDFEESVSTSFSVPAELSISPSGWEFEDLYEVYMQIIVPPDVKERLETEKGSVPRPASESECEAIRIAKRLHQRDIFQFTLGTEADMPFLGVYMISPMGKYLINRAEGRLILIDMESQLVVWEDLMLINTVRIAYAMDEALLAYAVWRNGEEIRFVDLDAMIAYPSIPPKRIDGFRTRMQHYVIDPSGKYIAVRHQYRNSVRTKNDEYSHQVRDIATGEVLFDLESSNFQLTESKRDYKEWRFSPGARYITHEGEEEYVLFDWRSSEAATRIPIEVGYPYVKESIEFSPDEGTVAVLYNRSLPNVKDSNTRVQFWDVSSGEMIREIPVPEDTGSIEFLDNETALVIPREDEWPHKEALILRWNDSGEGEARVHYSTW